MLKDIKIGAYVGHRGVLSAMLWMRGDACIENGWIRLKPDAKNTYSPEPHPKLVEGSAWFDLALIGKELLLGQPLNEKAVLRFVRQHGLLWNGVHNPRAFEVRKKDGLLLWHRRREDCPYSKDFLCENIVEWIGAAKAIYTVIFIHQYLNQAIQDRTQKTATAVLKADDQLAEIHAVICKDLSQQYPHVFGHLEHYFDDEATGRRDLSQVISMLVSSGLQDVREQIISASSTFTYQGSRIFEDTHGIESGLTEVERKDIKRAGQVGEFIFSPYCPDLYSLLYVQLSQYVMSKVPLAFCPCGIFFQTSREDNKHHNDACRQRFGRERRQVNT